jgi:hypothetical protein
MKQKTIKIGTLKTPKSRDLLHLQEITHGSGAGAHKSRKDYNRQRAKMETKGQSPDWPSVLFMGYKLCQG